MLRSLHLFAGAGGGLLADLILGHEPVCAVEWDAYCCAVLRERVAEGWFPGLRVLEVDVRLFDPSEWAGRVDCISAGFPCQDISVAGKGAGLAGERSGLWSEVRRAVGVIRPAHVFLENSPAIVGRGLERVLGDLAALGYDARWLVLGADDIGAPHRRDRWWCLAWRADAVRGGFQEHGEHDQRPDQSEPDASGRGYAGRFCATVPSDLRRPVDDTVRGRHGSSEGEVRAGREAPVAPSWWEVEPDVGRVVNGMASRVDRLHALGNGQVPLCAATAWCLLGGPR